MATQYVFFVLVIIGCVSSQITPGFNDFSPDGTEKELDLIYEEIDKLAGNISEIQEAVEKLDGDVRFLGQMTTDDVSAEITKAIDDVASLARSAGFPLCAIQASQFSLTAVPKYRAQIQMANNAYAFSSTRTKGLATASKGSVGLFRKSADLTSLRGCQGPLVRIFGPTAIANCYRTNFIRITNLFRTLNTSVQTLSKEFENSKKLYDDFIAKTSSIQNEAKAETDKTVSRIMECAKLNVPGVDFSAELFTELKGEIDVKIKNPAQKILGDIAKLTINAGGNSFQADLQSQVIAPLKAAYEKSFQLIPDQAVSLEDKIKSADLLIRDNKDFAIDLVDSFITNRASGFKDDIIQTEKNIEIELEKFRVALNSTKCIKTVKQIFLNCIEPILTAFKAKIAAAGKKVQVSNSPVDFLLNGVSAPQSAKNEIAKKLSELVKQSQVEINNQNYLIERRQKLLKTVVDEAPSRNDIFNKLNSYNVKIDADLGAFQDTLKNTVGASAELNAYATFQQNKIQSLRSKLNLLIETGKQKVQNAESDLKSTIEKYKEFKISCDGQDFKSCVDMHYANKDAELSASVNAFKTTSGSVAAMIDADIASLNQEIVNALNETKEKVKAEQEKTSNEGMWKQLISDAVIKYNTNLNGITANLNQAFGRLNNVSAALTVLSDRAKANPNLNVTLTIGNLTTIKNVNGFGGCNVINVVSNTYSGALKQLQLFENVVSQSRASVSESNLYELCSGAASSAASFTACLDGQLKLPAVDLSGFNEIVSSVGISA